MIRIGIIGGGASGLTAAIAAKRADKNAEVFIIEHKDTLGKKILSTGNGRCNLTNELMTAECFRSRQMPQVEKIVGQFGVEQTFSFFASMGVVLKSKSGYIYPRSGQASAVLEALTAQIQHLGISVYTGMHVTDLTVSKKGWQIVCGENRLKADKVILAAGGKASAVLGSDGSGYTLAKSAGHTIIPVVPALVQLKIKAHPFVKAAGVRTDAKVTAVIEGQELSSDTGELQITAYGISGIPVFQISRYIAEAVYEKRSAQVQIDFVPEMSKNEWEQFLLQRSKDSGFLKGETFLESIFPAKLNAVLLKLAGIPSDTCIAALSKTMLLTLADYCKALTLTVADTNGFANAQVCAGGVDLSEVSPETMESRCQKGLYLTGELLDADGICGGYNLQWAWATGYLAGTNAVCRGVEK